MCAHVLLGSYFFYSLLQSKLNGLFYFDNNQCFAWFYYCRGVTDNLLTMETNVSTHLLLTIINLFNISVKCFAWSKYCHDVTDILITLETDVSPHLLLTCFHQFFILYTLSLVCFHIASFVPWYFQLRGVDHYTNSTSGLVWWAFGDTNWLF